jgi:PTS system mannose-specific IID component
VIDSRVAGPAPAAPKLTGDDLARAASRSLQIQALLAPERMQGPGFAFALLPVLRRLYPEREERGRALARHCGYFATHPVLAGYVLGVAASHEERRAREETADDGALDALKRALGSALAGLGDPFFWVTLRPLAGLVGVLAVALLPPPIAGAPDVRVLLCPLATLLTYNAFALPYRFGGVARGYVRADQPGALVRSLRLGEGQAALSAAGSLLYGALIALAAVSLDLGSQRWGGDERARLSGVTPLLLGALVGFLGLKRWPGRVVEVALLAVLAAAAAACV